MEANTLDRSLPNVLLLCDYDSLSVEFVKKLISHFCNLIIASNENEIFQNNLKEFNLNNKILFVLPKEAQKIPCDYLVSINNFDCNYSVNTDRELEILIEKINYELSIAKKNNSKTIFTFPFLQTKKVKDRLLIFRREALNQNKIPLSIIYTGQVIKSEEKQFKKDLLIKIVMLVKIKNKIPYINKKQAFYPVRVEDVVKFLVKNLFSFGMYGSEVAIISKKFSSQRFLKMLKQRFPQAKQEKKFKYQKTSRVKVRKIIKKDINFEELIRQLIDEVERNTNYKRKFSGKGLVKKIKFGKVEKRNYLQLFIYFLIVLLSPLILLVFSFSLLLFAKYNFLNAKYFLAKKSYLVSEKMARFSKFQLYYSAKVPLMNNLNKLYSISSVLIKIDEIGMKATGIAETSSGLFEKITNNESYNIEKYSDKIFKDFEYLYLNLGFLQGDLESHKYPEWIKNKRFSKEETGKIREKIYYARNLIESLPFILGNDKPTNYLILINDNNELRPQGGLIIAYGIFKFDKGNLVAKEFQDTNFIDNKIKGKLDPPNQIKKYLSQDNWFFRDLNWDSNFLTSAQKAEWFLNKAGEEKIDGVISIDLKTLKDLLTIIGKIEMGEDQQEVSNENFYQIYFDQRDEHIENDSQKERFIISLSEKLLEQLFKIEKKNQIFLARKLFENLEEKHIQLYLNDEKAHDYLLKLSWTGQIPDANCNKNCFFDWVTILETNLGKNNSNFYVKRNVDLEINLEEKEIRKKLILSLENTSENPDGRIYKAYIRLLTPKLSNFGPIEITDISRKSLLEPDIINSEEVETGVYLELQPQEKKQIVFSWKSFPKMNFDGDGQYLLYYQKQAGTEDYPLNIKMTVPKGIDLKTSPVFTLTNDDQYSYNTSLSRDLFSRIYWK